MALTGKCLCGAVTYKHSAKEPEIGACHCSMCRRFSGGVYIGMMAKPGEVSFSGEDNLTVFKSSDWAERAFCKSCGSSMFYRVTAPGPYHGTYYLGAGTLDDYAGLTMSGEIFIEAKPDAYNFAGDLNRMRGDEIMAAMSAPADQ